MEINFSNVWKRSLSMLLALVMVLGMLPVSALHVHAAEITDSDGDGFAWDGTTLYVKDGKITQDQLWSLLYDHDSFTNPATTSVKKIMGLKYGGFELKLDSSTYYVGDTNSTDDSQFSSLSEGTYSCRYYQTWYRDTSNLTIKYYYVIETAVAEGSPAGAGISVDTKNVVNGGTTKVTVNDVKGYTPSVTDSKGNAVTNLDEYAPTASTTLTVTYTSNEVEKYDVTVSTVNGTYGTATLKSEAELPAGAEALVEVTPKTGDDGHKYEVVSVKVGETALSKNANGYYVYTMGEADVTITVTFKATTLEKNESIGTVKFNPKQDVSTQLDALKQYIFAAVVNSDASLPEGIEYTDLEYQYYPYAQGKLGVSIEGFRDEDLRNLETAAPNDTWTDSLGGNGLRYFDFGQRYVEGAADDEDPAVEKVLLTGTSNWAGLSVEAEITLVEARPKPEVTLDTSKLGKYDTFEQFEAAVMADGVISVVYGENDTAITGYNVTITPVTDGAPHPTTYNVVVKVATGTADYLAVEETIQVTSQINTYDIQWDTDGDGNVDVTQNVAYGSVIAPPAAATLENKSFAGWVDATTENALAAGTTVTGPASYKATYSNHKIHTITWLVDGVAYETVYVNETLGQKIPALSKANPDKDYAVFDKWTNIELVDTVPTADVTFEATWLADSNNNNVYDENEKVTIVISDNGTVKVNGEKFNGGEYLFDSTKTETLEIQFIPGSGFYVNTVSLNGAAVNAAQNTLNFTYSYTPADGDVFAASFEERTITVNAGAKVPFNPYKVDHLLSYSGYAAELEAAIKNALGVPNASIRIYVSSYEAIGQQWQPLRATNMTALNVGVEKIKVILPADGKLPEVSGEFTVELYDERSNSGLVDGDLGNYEFLNDAELNSWLAGKLDKVVSNINPNGLDVTIELSEGVTLPDFGVDKFVTYTVSFGGDATYKSGSCQVTVTVKRTAASCEIVVGENTHGSVSGTGTVDGLKDVSVVITPAAGYFVEGVTVSNLAGQPTVSYANGVCTVSFKTAGNEGPVTHTVDVTYGEVKLELKDKPTIQYQVGNDNKEGLREQIIKAAIAAWSPEDLKNCDVSVTYNVLTHLDVPDWALNLVQGLASKDVEESDGGSIAGFQYAHKFGETGVEKVTITYTSEKYGTVSAAFELVVEDTRYNATVDYTETNDTKGDSSKVEIKGDSKTYTDGAFYLQGSTVTVQVTPGNGLVSLGKSAAYVKEIKVNGASLPVTYNAATTLAEATASVSFTAEANGEYHVEVVYGEISVSAHDGTLNAYKGVTGLYDPLIPDVVALGQNLGLTTTISEDESPAKYEFSYEFSLDGLTYTSDLSVLLDRVDKGEGTLYIKATVTEPGAENKYRELYTSAKVTVVDPRTDSVITANGFEDAVPFINLEDMNITVNGNVYTESTDDVKITVVVDASNIATVTIEYLGSKDYKPATYTVNDISVLGTAVLEVESESGSVSVNGVTNDSGEHNVTTYNKHSIAVKPNAGFAVEAVEVFKGEQLVATLELTYSEQVATAEFTPTELETYTVKVTYVPAEFEFHAEADRVLNFRFGIDSIEQLKARSGRVVTLDTIFNTVVAGPVEAEDGEYKLQYLARPAGKVTISIPEIQVFGSLKIPATEIPVDMPELWLTPGEQINEITVQQLVDEIIPKLTSGEMSITQIASYVQTLHLGAHAFGANGDGSVETLRISYKDAKWDIATTKVTLMVEDLRTETTVSGNNATVVYSEYDYNSLLAQIAPVVSANGAAIDGAAVTITDITGKDVGTYTVTLSFAGDENYKPSTSTVEVVIEKGTCSIDFDSQVVIYGDPYDFTLSNPKDVDTIDFMIGVDLHEMLDGFQFVGVEPYIQVVFPQIEILGVKLDVPAGEYTLNEFVNLLKGIATTLEGAETIIEIITEIQEGLKVTDMTIVVGGEMHPDNIGLYLAGAVTVDNNYKTAYTLDYLMVVPKTIESQLHWNYNDENGVMTPELLKNENAIGAHATVEGVLNSQLTEDIKYLLLSVVVTPEGELDFDFQHLTGEQMATVHANGAYTQLAYYLPELANEIYYAAPIVRAFVIVPNIVDMQIVDNEGTAKDIFTHVFNHKTADILDVVVDRESVTGTVTFHYYGIQTNTELYDSDIAPTHAGVYAVTATYLEKDADGNIVAMGADVAELTILPAPSSVEVGNALIPFDGKYHGVNGFVTPITDSGVTSPDMTIISGGIAATNDASQNGLAGLTGTVNVDFPRWVDELMAEHLPEVKDGINATVLANKLAQLLVKLQDMGIDTEGLAPVVDTLAQLNDSVQLTFHDDVSYNAVGLYLVVGIVTDSDHLPSMDAGLMVIYPTVTMHYLKFNYEDQNNIFTRQLLDLLAAQGLDLNASAYEDAQFTTLDQAATEKVQNVFLTVASNGTITVETDWTKLGNGVYIELSYIPLEIGGMIDVSNLIARTVIVVPAVVNLEFADGENQEKTYNSQSQGMSDVIITDSQGNIITPNAGEVTVVYMGIGSNAMPYFGTTAPVHAGIYSVVAFYVDSAIEKAGACSGTLVIKPAKADIQVESQLVKYGNDYDIAVTVTPADSTIDPTDAKYLHMIAGVDITKNPDALSLQAINTINLDFPAAVDQVLTVLGVQNGITIGSLTKMTASIREALEKIGYENAYIDQAFQVLEQMAPGVTVTFYDDYKPVNVGVYFQIVSIFDPDYLPAMDAGLLVIYPDAAITEVEFNMAIPGALNILPFNAVESFDFGVHAADAVDTNGNTQAVNPDWIKNVIFGITSHGELFVGNDTNKPSEMGVYEQIGYMVPTELNDNYLFVGIPAIRAFTVVMSNYEVEFLDVTDSVNPHRWFVFDGTAKEMPAYVVDADGNKIEGLIPTVYYLGIDTALTPVWSKQAPTNAGTYSVMAYYFDEAANIYAMAFGQMVIEKGNLVFDLLDTTHIYDSAEKFVDINNPENAKYATIVETENGANILLPAELDALVELLPTTTFPGTDELKAALNAAAQKLSGTDVQLVDRFAEKLAELVSKIPTVEVITINGANPVAVGEYTVYALTYSSNYYSEASQAVLVIKPIEITVTVQDAEKIFGENDPAFGYEITEGALLENESLTVVYDRVAGENVGEYTINATATGAEHYQITVVPGTLTIHKATVTAPVIDSKPYNGLTQTADVDENSLYTVTTNNGGVNVGSYDVVLTLTDPTNYKWTDSDAASLTLIFQITKASDNAWTTEPSAQDWTYGDSSTVNAGVAKYGNVIVEYAVKGSNQFTAVAPVAAGEYTVRFTVAETENYNGLIATADFTIAKANAIYTVPTGLTSVYGKTLADVTLPNGFTWVDSTDSVGNAGNNTFKVTYTPADTNNYNVIENIEVTVAVAKADPAYTVPTGLTSVYGKTLADVTLPAGFSWQDAATTSVGGAGNNTFKVTYTPADTNNYNVIENIEVTVAVAKAASSVTTAPSANTGLVYNGNAQALVSGGSVTGGTLVYSLSENGPFTATVPAGTNAGSYTVYYKVVGDANHMDTQVASVNVTIKPCKITSDVFTVEESLRIRTITAGTTVKQLWEGINEKLYVTIFRGEDEAKDNALSATGMEAQLIIDGQIIDRVTVVVTGDVNGDGKITVTDMVAAKHHLLQKSTITGVYAIACDTNNDGNISITDFIQLKAHILQKSQIQAN